MTETKISIEIEPLTLFPGMRTPLRDGRSWVTTLSGDMEPREFAKLRESVDEELQRDHGWKLVRFDRETAP